MGHGLCRSWFGSLTCEPADALLVILDLDVVSACFATISWLCCHTTCSSFVGRDLYLLTPRNNLTGINLRASVVILQRLKDYRLVTNLDRDETRSVIIHRRKPVDHGSSLARPFTDVPTSTSSKTGCCERGQVGVPVYSNTDVAQKP